MSDHLYPTHDSVQDAGRAGPSPLDHRPLGEFLPDNGVSGSPRAVTVAWTGQDTVVVGRVTGSSVRLAPGGTAVTDVVSDGLQAQAVTDPVRERELYQRAITALAADLTATSTRLAAESGHNQVLRQRIDDIRQYAVDRHHDGDICRDGLDRFLSHFDLARGDHRRRRTGRPAWTSQLRAADIALYHARRTSAPYAVYQPGMPVPLHQDRLRDQHRDLRTEEQP